MTGTPRTASYLQNTAFPIGGPVGGITPQQVQDLIVSMPMPNIIHSPFRPDMPPYNAVFNGVISGSIGGTDDSAAWAAMFADINTQGWGEVKVPGGVSIINTALTVPSDCRIVGSGKNATILASSTGSNNVLQFNGSSTTVRCQRSSLADFQIFNGARLITAIFADHLNFDRVFVGNTTNNGWFLQDLWDTYFTDCETEFCGSTTALTGAAMYITGGATNSSNQLYFRNCRWESIPGTMLSLDSRGVGATAPYGIYMNHCKMESSFIGAQPFINASSDISYVHIRDCYLAADAQTGGATTAIIELKGNNNWILDGINFWVGATGVTSYCVRWNTTGNGHVLANLFQHGTAITAMIDWSVTTGAGYTIGNASAGSISPVFTGTTPSSVTLK